MLRGYTAKIYPSKEQAELLEKHFGCTRWMYNELIKINQKKYHRTGKGLSGFDMQTYLPKLKKQYPWLKEVNAQSLQIVTHNLANSYNRFFKKQAKYPRFKKKAADNSFMAVQDVIFTEKSIKLPKFKPMKYRGGPLPEGKLRRVVIKKCAGLYYVSALFERGESLPEIGDFDSITGIDLGLTHLAITSNGEKFKSSKFHKKAKQRIRLISKKLSRAQKGSNRRKKILIAAARAHLKVANQRKDYNHKISRILVNDCDNQAFGIESLAVKNMMKNRRLSFHIQDSAWRQFITFLKYKAEEAGKQVIEVDRFYPSSKTCYECGIVNEKLTLGDRKWVCDDCGSEHDRDINAACNIAFEAARNVAHGGVVSRGLVRVDASEVQILAAG